MNLDGKVAIVTGSGSKRGIGRAIVSTLSYRGATIIVADIDFEGATQIANELIANGKNAMPVKVDVTNENDVDKMVDEVLKKYGKIDILVNNAGITKSGKTWEHTTEDWDRIMSVNLKGTFICCKAVIKTMIEQKYGKIVNISSVSAKRGGGIFGGSAYCASKAGILGFQKCLAREVVESGITVNSISPGLTDTDITASLTEEQKRNICMGFPIKRPAQTSEIADVVAFLSSDDSSYITGEDINVNGGFHMD